MRASLIECGWHAMAIAERHFSVSSNGFKTSPMKTLLRLSTMLFCLSANAVYISPECPDSVNGGTRATGIIKRMRCACYEERARPLLNRHIGFAVGPAEVYQDLCVPTVTYYHFDRDPCLAKYKVLGFSNACEYLE